MNYNQTSIGGKANHKAPISDGDMWDLWLVLRHIIDEFASIVHLWTGNSQKNIYKLAM